MMKKLMTSTLLLAMLIATLPLISQTTMTDINGQEYSVVTVRNMFWMAENLNVDKFRNGDPIPHAQTAEEWMAAGEAGQSAWCYPDNDPAKGEKYGKLYNWFAITDPRGLAPEGWRVATDSDWSALTRAFGGNRRAGPQLKSTEGWLADGNGTNESGFAALPVSGRSFSGNHNSIGLDAFFWTSTAMSDDSGWYRSISCCDPVVERHGTNKKSGHSVRCVKD